MSSDRVNRLKTLLDQSPEDTFLNHAMGIEQVKLGNDEEARQFFEKVLELDADYVGTYYHLAKCMERHGNLQRALEVYKKGMEKAQNAGDQKTYNELMMAKEDLEYEIE